MFNLGNFLKEAFNPEDILYQNTSNSFLPELVISPTLKKGIDQISLDFLTSLYFASKKSQSLREQSEVWFLEEINQGIHDVYPNKSRREYVAILQQIIKMSDPDYGTEK